MRTPDELEQLSQLLDELNAGRRPDCDDAETAELLMVADLLREEGGAVRPPQHILDQTVERALAGIEASKSKPRVWWYSGAISTVAAVILVIGLNLLPSWQQQVPVVLPPPPAFQEQEAPSAKPVTEQPGNISQAVRDEPPPKPAEITPSQIKQSPVNESPKTRSAIVPPVTVEPKPPISTRIAEESARKGYSKSINLADDPPNIPLRSSTSVITPLVLPGTVPDLIVTDKDKGILRQVFFKGTLKELTIIQRPKPTDRRTTQEKSEPTTADKAFGNKEDSLNVIQVTIEDQDVTIKGRQPQQELLQLAESLTLKPLMP